MGVVFISLIKLTANWVEILLSLQTFRVIHRINRLVLLEEVAGTIGICVRVEDLVEPRIALVAVEKFNKLLDRDVSLGAEPTSYPQKREML